MSIVFYKHKLQCCDSKLDRLFREEAQEILDYIQQIWLELTQNIVLPNFSKGTIALAVDLMSILQSTAVGLDLIDVQISAYRLENLLRLLQQKQVVEINSELKKEILEAYEALELSLLPYLNTHPLEKDCETIETSKSLVRSDVKFERGVPISADLRGSITQIKSESWKTQFVSKQDHINLNQTIKIDLPIVEQPQIISSTANTNHVSAKLTLQTANLLVWLMDSNLFILPYDRIEKNLMPKFEQIIQLGEREFLQWQQQTIPIYPLSELLHSSNLPKLDYESTRVAELSLEMGLMLVVKQGQQVIVLKSAIERLVTQPELVIQPADTTLSYCYGFSFWEDTGRVRVIDVAALLEQIYLPS